MGSCASLYCQSEPEFVQAFAADATPISIVRPDPKTLHEACEDGEAKMVTYFMIGGEDPNVLDGEGWTGLHKAAFAGHAECVALLLTYSANVNATTSCEFNRLDWTISSAASPLHFAALNGHLQCIDILLQHGATPGATTSNGETPLCCAAWGGHIKCLEKLLLSGCSAATSNTDGQTPLHWAVTKGHSKCAVMLLDQGAHIDAADLDGQTSLGAAVSHNHYVSVRMLIGCGADIETTDNLGQRPIHLAAYNGHIQSMEILLQAGANINAVTDSGDTPLHASVSGGHLTSTELLLSKGAVPSLVDEDGRSALHLAAGIGHGECIKALISYGADVNALDNQRISPLHLACIAGDLESVRLLLEAGGSVTAKDSRGVTPLQWAEKLELQECFDLLQKYERMEEGGIDKHPFELASQRGANCVCSKPPLQSETVLDAVTSGALKPSEGSDIVNLSSGNLMQQLRTKTLPDSEVEGSQVALQPKVNVAPEHEECITELISLERGPLNTEHDSVGGIKFSQNQSPTRCTHHDHGLKSSPQTTSSGNHTEIHDALSQVDEEKSKIHNDHKGHEGHELPSLKEAWLQDQTKEHYGCPPKGMSSPQRRNPSTSSGLLLQRGARATDPTPESFESLGIFPRKIR